MSRDKSKSNWSPEMEMTIYTARDNKESLLKLVNDADEINVDLSNTSEIDCAGLQLLILAKREAVLKNKPFHIVAHSDAVQSALNITNLGGLFGISEIIPAKP